MKKPILGVSSCLLGEKVRYDGKLKFCKDLIEELQKSFKLVSFCPEVASGLPVPREPMDLFVVDNQIKMLTIESKKNITPFVQRVVSDVLDDYRKADICGFVFKSKSPSCGLRLAKVHRGNKVERNGMGLFAKAFIEVFPELPVATEFDLENLENRRDFISTVCSISKKKFL